MVEILASLYVVLLLSDFILILDLRKLVYSFLLSKRNIKGARKIHLLQSKISKITLAYIKDYAIYPREFRFFWRIWMIVLVTVIPQYVIAIICNIFSLRLAVILLIVFFIIKIALNILVAFQFKGRISRFDKRV